MGKWSDWINQVHTERIVEDKITEEPEVTDEEMMVVLDSIDPRWVVQSQHSMSNPEYYNILFYRNTKIASFRPNHFHKHRMYGISSDSLTPEEKEKMPEVVIHEPELWDGVHDKVVEQYKEYKTKIAEKNKVKEDNHLDQMNKYVEEYK